MKEELGIRRPEKSEGRIRKEETGNWSGGKKVEGRFRNEATKSKKEEL